MTKREALMEINAKQNAENEFANVTEKDLEEYIMKEQMIKYLQERLTEVKAEEAQFGIQDRIVIKKIDALIACKEMVEAIIMEPVNLGKDGKVTIGF